MSAPGFDLEAIVRRHQVSLWRYLRVLGAAADVADDLLQETFLVAFAKLSEDRGPAAVGTFLRSIARNLLLRQRRDRGRREALLIEMADRAWQQECDTDGDVDGDGWLQALEACLRQLDGKTSRVVQLFYREARSRSEVAVALGIKETGLKTLLQRLRAGLRSCIEARQKGAR